MSQKQYAESQQTQEYIWSLGEIFWLHESTISDALQLCVDRLPHTQISKYERVLDQIKRLKK